MRGCLNPQDAWICGTVLTKDGVVSPRMVFSATEAMNWYKSIGCLFKMDDNKVQVPCGHCYACQVEKRKHWSTRLAHEASMYENSCFITLTYNDRHIPVTDWNPLKDPEKQFDRGSGELPEYTLLPSDVQKFMKRLRRHLEYVPKRKPPFTRDHVKVRYFACGEYGSKTHRPHYHILIFGWKPSDGLLLKMANGRPVYTSEQIKKCWTMIDDDGEKRPIGFVSYSDVTPFVAKYVARYVTKKMQHIEDGSNKYVVPEFSLQSVRGGGIGAPWLDKYGREQLPRRFVDYRAGDRIIKAAIPPYYLHRLRKTNQPLWLKLRDERLEFAKHHRGALCHSLRYYEDLCAFVATEMCKAQYFKTKETF